jgi:hypothetical protein
MPETTVQAELLRLQCLQALGITVYHPRFRLPGAKPSVQGPWAEGAPQSAPKRVEIAVPPAAAKVPASPVPAPRAVNKVVDAAADKAGAPATVQNFQLLFFQIDDDLAIVNQIPALARPQLQDKQMALLANLLRWLGKPVPAQAPRMFRWPLPGLEHIAASMNPQTSLLHFLEQAASERGFRFLLQLGPQAVTPGASAWQAFTTHSLDEMLALPSLKREVWQTLLPLHEALH